MSFGSMLGGFVGGISLNNNVVLKTPNVFQTRGFNIIELNVGNCSVSSYHNFDTYAAASQSTALANYINSLSMKTVLVGVTADEPQAALNAAAMNALLAIGVNVNGLTFGGKVSFIAQVGRSSIALMKIATSPPYEVLALTADVRCK